MHYIGGGTAFPFPVLGDSVAECRGRQPIRAIITDPDFDANYDAGETGAHARIFAEAARESPYLVLLLHRPLPERIRLYQSTGARVVAIPAMDDFPRMAVDLARALFPEQGHVGS
jgi:hypothetical protein